MSHAEFSRWLAYRRAHGPLTDERRFDRPAALHAYLFAQVNAKPGSAPDSIADFMPWSEPADATLDDIAKELGIVNG